MITPSQIMGLSDEHLIELNNGHSLLTHVKNAFEKMQKSAAKQGIDLQICSSFRSFERQLSIWNRKWNGELPLYSLKGEMLNAHTLSDAEKIHAIMLWSALPGASRHHWGSDFDVYDKANVEALGHDFQLVPEEYEGSGPCAKLYTWLSTNAQNFGFSFPYAEYVGGVAKEPWHLSHAQTALAIESNFSIERLAKTLSESDICGKNAILENIEQLVHRYTFNEGNKS